MRALTRLAVLAAAILAAAAAALVWSDRSQDHGLLTAGDLSAAASSPDVSAAARLRVFFAHQSVGGNLVDALPGAYRAFDVPTPPVVEVSAATAVPPELADGGRGGAFAHVLIGENGDPLGKIRDFDARVRAGIGDHIDVAMLKLCYIDLTDGVDVDEVFEAYRSTYDALRRDFPDVAFVPVTTPLTTEPALTARIKGMLGGQVPGPADNAARERFNHLLRSTYGDRVFDVAALESTAPDGSRVSGTSEGRDYFALYDGYATDEGHLDRLAAEVLAARLLGFLAEQAA